VTKIKPVFMSMGGTHKIRNAS